MKYTPITSGEDLYKGNDDPVDWINHRVWCLEQALAGTLNHPYPHHDLIGLHTHNVLYWMSRHNPPLALRDIDGLPDTVIAHFAEKLFTGPTQCDP